MGLGKGWQDGHDWPLRLPQQLPGSRTSMINSTLVRWFFDLIIPTIVSFISLPKVPEIPLRTIHTSVQLRHIWRHERRKARRKYKERRTSLQLLPQHSTRVIFKVR
ncbi:hypothetical protein VTK56DRAFT_1224 [Thermocarpiscus australiensis]